MKMRSLRLDVLGLMMALALSAEAQTTSLSTTPSSSTQPASPPGTTTTPSSSTVPASTGNLPASAPVRDDGATHNAVDNGFTSIYLSRAYQGGLFSPGNGAGIYVRPNGQVYDTHGVLVGRITDAAGNALATMPATGDYYIRATNGGIIGSTGRNGSGIDGNRTLMLGRSDANGVPLSGGSNGTANRTAPAPAPAGPAATGASGTGGTTGASHR